MRFHICTRNSRTLHRDWQSPEIEGVIWYLRDLKNSEVLTRGKVRGMGFGRPKSRFLVDQSPDLLACKQLASCCSRIYDPLRRS